MFLNKLREKKIKIMKGYKVTDKKMKCRNSQFELGVEFTQEGGIKSYKSGYRNSGYHNSGSYNSGNDNSGNDNSGCRNSGDFNSGYYNSGNYNSGAYNSGDNNSGSRNYGSHNSGWYNSGHSNSGDFNSTNYSAGFFNSEEQTIFMFNKDTGLRRHELDLPCIDLKLNEWITSSEMSKIEKEDNPNWETLGGYLKQISYKEAWEKSWTNLDEKGKQKFLNLPNFDAEIFEEITGIKTNK